MPFLRRPSSFVLVLVLTAGAVDSGAQPALPRDRIPSMPAGIRALVDRLYSADPKVRAEAACELGRRPVGAASAIPVLLSMLADDVVVPAIECEMSAWMRRTLPTNPDAQRWLQTSPAKEAAEALADIGNPAVPGLLEALGHSDWKVRRFAAVGLGEMDNILDLGNVLNALARSLADAHVEVRERSAWALGEIEEPGAVEALVTALRDADARVRARAAWALGEIEDPTAVSGLVAALNDGDPAVREKAVWALGEIESERAVDGLANLLRDTDARVRRQAAWALGEIESAAAVPALVQALADSEASVRRQAAWALGEIEADTAVDGLIDALRDSDAEVRRQAAWALGEIEDISALEALRAAARDPSPEVRRAVANAIRELGDRRQRRQ